MRRWSIIMAFAIVYSIWGSTYLAIGIAVESVPPLAAAGLRFCVAGAVLYAIARGTHDERPTARHWRTALILGTLLPACGNGLIFIAQQSVASSVSAVFVATEPIFIALLSAVWLGAPLTRGGWVGIGCGTLGIVLMAAPWEAGASDLRGLGLLCLGSLAWSLGSLYSRNAPAPRSPLLGAGMTMLVGGVLLVGASAGLGEWRGFDPSTVSQRSLLALLYLIIAGSLLAYTAYLYLLRHVSPGKVASYAYVNPLVGLLVGVGIAGESVGTRGLIAAVAIIAGALLMLAAGERPQRRRRAAA